MSAQRWTRRGSSELAPSSLGWSTLRMACRSNDRPDHWNFSVNFLKSSSHCVEVASVPIDCLLISMELLPWFDNDNKNATLATYGAARGGAAHHQLRFGSGYNKLRRPLRSKGRHLSSGSASRSAMAYNTRGLWPSPE